MMNEFVSWSKNDFLSKNINDYNENFYISLQLNYN